MFDAWLLGSELQVPSLMILPCACEHTENISGLPLGVEPKIQELSQGGEEKKMVLFCLRIAKSFRRPPWKILMKISVLNIITLYRSTSQLLLMQPCTFALQNSFFFSPKKVILMHNALKFCKNLDTSPPLLHVETYQACGFGACPFLYAPATSQFIISNNFQC